jgi:hypothetical protein
MMTSHSAGAGGLSGGQAYRPPDRVVCRLAHGLQTTLSLCSRVQMVYSMGRKCAESHLCTLPSPYTTVCVVRKVQLVERYG